MAAEDKQLLTLHSSSSAETIVPKILLHVVEVGCGLTVIVQHGSSVFLSDSGCKSEFHCKSLKEALVELIGTHSLKVVGATLIDLQPGLEYLIREGIVKEMTGIISANVDLKTCLKSASCQELNRLSLDNLSARVEEKELLNGLSLCFYFKRKYPLVRYKISQNSDEELQMKGNEEESGEQQMLESSNSKVDSIDSSDFDENNIILSIKPSLAKNYPSVLITGNASVSRIFKAGVISNDPLSVFIVPRQENEECLSLLPEDARKQLSDPASMADAALHLALYYKRKSFVSSVSRLEGKLKKSGDSFLSHYTSKELNPEEDLKDMLLSPKAKVSQIFLLSKHFQLDWYKKNKQVVFSDLVKASVADEESKQQKRLSFFKDSLAWAHFYKCICAEVYVMSAEDLKVKSHLAVLNGIIIANFWRKTKCCICITGTLPHSLDEIIQRDVRKLVFPDGKSEPAVRIGFLSNPFPFFTINPWSQAQCHGKSNYPTVLVDTSRHSVSGLGDEHSMHLIRDELDVKEALSTKESNAIIDHVTYSHKPPLSKTSFNEFRFLEAYLNLIGFNISCGTFTMDSVLECIIGPLLVQQLIRGIAYEDVDDIAKIIPDLLKLKCCGKSKIILTPTKSAALKAELDVKIPPKKPLLIGNKVVKDAAIFVKNAKTMSLALTLKATINSEPKPISFEISKLLDLRGSCGETVADYIYGICCKEDAWFPARKLTVGEVLHVFLHEEKAFMAIQSLPLFLSYPLSKCKITHYLTTVVADPSQSLKEAYVHVNLVSRKDQKFKPAGDVITNPFELPPIVKKTKMCVKIKSFALQIFPLCDVDQDMIQINGDCIVNSLPMKFVCHSTSESQKNMKIFFTAAEQSTMLYKLFGISTQLVDFSSPICGITFCSRATYEGGFVLSQLSKNIEEVTLTSLFLGVEFCNRVELEQFLPSTLNHIQHAKVSAVVHFPLALTPKLGLEASFESILKVGSAETETLTLQCRLLVQPSFTDSSYAYKVVIKHSSSQHKPQDLKGMSLFDLISALNGTLGNDVVEEIGKIPTLGDQILNNVSLRKLVLKLEKQEIQVLEIHVIVSELDIVPNKLSVKDCELVMFYSSKDGLSLECGGNLVLLNHFQYSIHFNLPTSSKKGELSFRCYTSDLIIKDLMKEFGWLSCEVESNPVLTKVLDVAVRKVVLDFHFTPGDGKLQVTASEISIYKETLDLGLVSFHNLEIDVLIELVDSNYATSFSLQAYISNALYAQLKYNPETHVLSGKVSVTFSNSVSAVDVLQIFKSSTASYDNMKSILHEDFMTVFDSDLKILSQPGLTASLCIDIGLPSEKSKQFSLERLNLEVEDALKVCCKNTYVLNTFQFEYFNKSHLKDVSPTSHLTLAVHKLNSKESMILDFDFTSKKGGIGFFTAKVKAGPQGGFLKLSSAIDLARAAVPDLPDFDVGLPPIFDIELVSGSVTFAIAPSFQPSAFDVNILISEWQMLDDPELSVHKLTLKTAWESGSYPQLLFTDCSLTFLEHKLNLNGKLTSEEVYIECCSAEKLPETSPTQFKSILEKYTPNSQPQPVLPTNIGLPPMEVELRELIIQLKKAESKFRVNTGIVARSPWEINFGDHTIPVYELGGALEWDKLEGKTTYKAFLYGTVELFNVPVDMEMLLRKNIDSIVSASISKSVYYGQIVDNLLCSEAITSYDQYNSTSSGLSELVPFTMQDISLTSAATALNVTKKQLYLSSKTQGWGAGSLLIGYLASKDEMDYIVSLSLDERFKFERLSESLAFVDELVVLRNLNVLISSNNFKSLSDLTKTFCHSFTRSKVREQLQKPFYEFSCTDLARFGIRIGTTVYAKLNIAQSKGGINKLLELGDTVSLKDDISVMTYIGKSETKRDLEIHAWIPRIFLFEILEFSDIHLMYRVQSESEFELTGAVALHMNVNENNPVLKFNGKLLVNSSFAEFSTKMCTDLVNRPCGINIQVNDLKLAMKKYLNGDSPDVFVSGRLRIGYISLTCMFLLKGASFKVFLMRLEHGLKLSALFSCSAVDWPIQLDIEIKEGQFYYASISAKFEENGQLCAYDDGYHLEAVVNVLNSDFRIKADIPSDRSNVVLSGRSIEQIDFIFAKITGAHPYTDEGPELSYNGSEKSLALKVGVEILKHPCFEGELKYKSQDQLEGTIRYPGQFLWVREPSMTVQWSKEKGFNIVDFSLNGDSGFSFLGAVAKFAKIIYDIVRGTLSWKVDLHVKTGENPNPKKHLVKLILYGEFVITVIGLNLPVFPLPEIPILLPRVDNFSFAKLPQYILKCLWDSAGPICKSLLNYINPWNLLCKSVKMIWGGIKGAISTVGNVVKKFGNAVSTGFKAVKNCDDCHLSLSINIPCGHLVTT